MSQFERDLPAYRLAQTNRGDTLQTVAGRELGDANRWPELIWLNKLVHPYLTDDEAQAGEHVLLTGQLIMVPSASGTYTDSAETGQVYERDCQLVGKMLLDDGNGDFAVVAGVDNFTQQIKHRIDTPRGQAARHPEYGCLVWSLQGSVNGPIAGQLGAEYVKSALMADYRVASVPNCTATVTGDQVRITATAEGIDGAAVDLPS